MRLPWSVKAGLLGGALVALGLGVYWTARVPQLRASTMARVDRSLLGTVQAFSAGLGPRALEDPDLDARVKRVRRDGSVRLTIIGADGRVLADTDVPEIGLMANHGSRPEVAEARRDGVALSSRTSDSVNRELRYAALRLPGSAVVARAALDARAIAAWVDEETRFPWLPGLAATLFAGLLGGVLSAPTAAGVRRVAGALSRLEQGDLATRVPVRGPDFLRGLSQSFNAMATRLEDDVARVSAERARLSTVLDGMLEGVLAIDGEETVRFVNRAGRALLDLDPAEPVEGKPFHHLVREPHLLGIVRSALGRASSEEADLVWGGAPRRLLHVRAAPVGGAGPGAILLVGDVSTLRRLERMRSDFVANVSHELRTPLAAITGAAETLLDGALADAEAAPRFTSSIARHAERLCAIVDDLLALSRLESTPESIERVPVDFALVARQACEAVAQRAQQAGLRLDVSSGTPARVLGDPEALRRLVDNLVVNALTYTPAGGWVRVGVNASEGQAILTVADSGIGIPAEHLDRVFERFYRVDRARSRSKGGTGLGLAIVKHSVNLHGGQVRVESRPGVGSTFTVTIPLARATDLSRIAEGGSS